MNNNLIQREEHYLKKELDQLIQNDASIFHFIQQSSLDGIWYWDLEQPQHEWMSEKFWTTLGYDPQSMPHQPSAWQDIVFADDMSAAENSIKLHLEDPSIPFDQVIRYRHAQGTTVWIRCRGLAIRNELAKPIRMLGAHTDITQIKRKEEELQAFLDEAHDLIQSVDQQGKYVYVNRAWCDTLGYSQQEAEALSMFEVIDPEFIPHCKVLFQKLISTREPQSVQVVLRSKEGKAVRAEGNVSVYQQADGKLVTRGIFRDITLRYNAEQELSRTKELLEQTSQVARVGGWEYNVDTRLVHWTSMTKQIHEVDPDYAPDINSYKEFLREGESKDTIERVMKQAMDQGTAFDVEHQILTAGDHDRWVRFIGHVEQKNGRTTRLYGTIQDIELQKQAELQLVQATEASHKASQAKSEFLANMSHEIRTPLNGVIGFTELLMKTKMDESQHQYMEAIHHSAHALLDLINDILDFSKIEAGKLELVEETTDLWQLFTQIGNIVKPKVDDKDIELLFNIDPRLPQYAKIDSVRLRQILINLFSNAVKFTRSGEIEVSVKKIEAVAGNAAELFQFAVRDTGVGIDPDRQKSIFEAFSQEDASTSRKYGGTGLGLAITNQLLALMGSELELESQPGKGSIFSFTLPLTAEKPNNSMEALQIPVEKVLVVDDHEKNLKIVEDILTLMDIEADLASNGIEALQKLENSTYDAMIIDYHMPFMDGLQVIEKARNTLNLDSKKLPVILAHSSSEDSTINEKRRSLQIQQVISKPITIEQLKFTLQRLHIANSGSDVQIPAESADTSEQALTLLLVDDNPMNRKLARSMVKQILPQAAITEAENGQEAVDYFEKYPADIVLMDIQMPLMNGYEASRKIRQLPGGDKSRIIALTASAIKGERERCLEAGMDDYMTKPVIMEKLSRQLLHLELKPDVQGITQEKEEISEYSFDLEKFKENVKMVDEGILSEMLTLLMHQLQEDVPRLKPALEQHDFRTIRSIAHKHKGSTGTAGMPVLSDLFIKLESRSAEEQTQLNTLIDEVESTFRQVKNEVLATFPDLVI
jgi:PAS domain S-box-containing protein